MDALSTAAPSDMSLSAIHSFEDIDFESCHRIMNAFMESFQNKFSKDTNYKRPLLAPQANIVFALDSEVAGQMIAYMSNVLTNIAGFTQEEFFITLKSSMDGIGLQRIRLEFRQGVNRNVLWKIFQATNKLAS